MVNKKFGVNFLNNQALNGARHVKRVTKADGYVEMRPVTKDPLDKDVIVYCGMDYGVDGWIRDGVDGRGPAKVMYAYLTPEQLDRRIADDKNKAWRTVEKKIVNLATVKAQALAKLDGIEKMAINMMQLPKGI